MMLFSCSFRYFINKLLNLLIGTRQYRILSRFIFKISTHSKMFSLHCIPGEIYAYILFIVTSHKYKLHSQQTQSWTWIMHTFFKVKKLIDWVRKRCSCKIFILIMHVIQTEKVMAESFLFRMRLPMMKANIKAVDSTYFIY